jgi:hypothetical protein
MQAHIADITMAIEVAMAQRASTLLTPLETVARALNNLDIMIMQNGYKLLVTKPVEIFQCKASYLVYRGALKYL